MPPAMKRDYTEGREYCVGVKGWEGVRKVERFPSTSFYSQSHQTREGDKGAVASSSACVCSAVTRRKKILLDIAGQSGFGKPNVVPLLTNDADHKQTAVIQARDFFSVHDAII